MTGASLHSRTRSVWAAAIAASLALGAVAAYGWAAPSPQLGSLATVNLCARKAGPKKGDVRFVEKQRYCKANELRVGVLGEGSTQSALGFSGAGASATGPRSAPTAAPATGYVRVEGVSGLAVGTPETANASVACPGDSEVVGGGYRVEAGTPSAANNPAEVVVTESRASSDTIWSVTAFADDAEDVGPWSVAAYAICADTTG
jgi:hypothetical protein